MYNKNVGSDHKIFYVKLIQYLVHIPKRVKILGATDKKLKFIVNGTDNSANRKP